MKLLLVEDDASLAAIIKEALEELGFPVLYAQNGKAAQQTFMIEPIGLVVSDIRMPQMNGIELLHWVKKLKPIPVILMTGFSELCEAKEAFELGADGFLPKPFEKKDLQAMISNCLAKSDRPATIDLRDQFCKMNVEDFVSGKSMQFDIYLSLSSKFIKIAHRGEDLPLERIRAYKSKGLRFLYIKKEDFARYVGLSVALTRAAKEANTISTEKKLNLVKHTGEIILEKIRFDGVDKDCYDYATTFIENAVMILGEDPDAFNLLELLKGHTDFVYIHSVAVSMISVLIAREMHWSSVANFFKIAMGGLLHDVGMKEINAALLAKQRKDLVPSDVQEIERHAWRGFEILGHLRSVSGDVVQIVAQHHENCLGQGYPKKLRKKQIHPLARLVAVADEFCNLVLKVPNSPELTAKEAVQRLLNFSWDKLDTDFLIALARIFKVTPEGSILAKASPAMMGKTWA